MVTFHDLCHQAIDEIYAMYPHVDIIETDQFETKEGSVEAINVDPASYNLPEIGQDFRDILTKYCQENEVSIDVQDLKHLPRQFSFTSGDQMIYVNLHQTVTCFALIKLI